MASVAATVPVAGKGFIEMDGHRNDGYEMMSDDGPMPIAQMRVTASNGDIIEVAMSRPQIDALRDVLGLYL